MFSTSIIRSWDIGVEHSTDHAHKPHARSWTATSTEREINRAVLAHIREIKVSKRSVYGVQSTPSHTCTSAAAITHYMRTLNQCSSMGKEFLFWLLCRTYTGARFSVQIWTANAKIRSLYVCVRVNAYKLLFWKRKMVDREMFAVCLFGLKSVFVILTINLEQIWCAYDGKYRNILLDCRR